MTNSASIEAQVPGWYGKTPFLGDFASRRLPNEFIDPWDDWLQRSIAASRTHLGDQWLDVYLTSPMWRFALGANVCGANAWAGLLVPSVDKVGRYFPLTFAWPLEPIGNLASTVFSADSWYEKLEQTALAALNVDYTTEQLEEALGNTPFPGDSIQQRAEVTREIASWLQAPDIVPTAFRLPGHDSLASAMSGACNDLFGVATSGRSFWWSLSHDPAGMELHCSIGLPAPDYYQVLLSALRPPPAPPEPSEQPPDVPAEQ